MKMAVVGCEASGKTVFMCALADYYGRDAVDNPLRLRLTPENAAANNLERFQFRQMRCLRQWPPATAPERTVEVKWTLRHEGKPLATIDMLEFGGETYRAAFRDNADKSREGSVAELFNYLGDADFFVILVSIKALIACSDAASKEDFSRETEALWVTRGILEFIRRKRPGAGAVIGLTQADRYREELGEAGGPRQLFAKHWPTVAAAIGDMPVVEVASVSKTDESGNPAEGFRTHGILPVMRIFAKHCLGDENALESGGKKLSWRLRLLRGPLALRRFGLVAASAVFLGILAATALQVRRSALREARLHPSIVTNRVETVVTNSYETIVEKPVTNLVEKLVEVPVTNVVEKLVREVVEVPVTNTVEKVIAIPVTNTIERVVERILTNVVEKVVFPTNATDEAELQQPLPPDHRVWTDYNGRKIVARWTGVSDDGSTITIVTRTNRKIEALLRKFSSADQAYVREEIKRHADKNEIMFDGLWIPNPLFKTK